MKDSVNLFLKQARKITGSFCGKSFDKNKFFVYKFESKQKETGSI